MQFREWAAWAINTINTTMRLQALRVDFDIMNQIPKDSRAIQLLAKLGMKSRKSDDKKVNFLGNLLKLVRESQFQTSFEACEIALTKGCVNVSRKCLKTLL